MVPTRARLVFTVPARAGLAARSVVSLLVAVAIPLAGACSSSRGGAGADGGTGADGASVSGVPVGAHGEDLPGPNGFDLDIPAGALGSTVVIGASALAPSSYPSDLPALPSKWLLQSYIYSFQPHHQTFAKPVSIALPYNNVTLPSLAVLTAEPSGSWSSLSGVDFASGIANFTTTHFSFYAVVTLASDTGASDSGEGADGGGGSHGDDGAPSGSCGVACTSSGGTCAGGACVCTGGDSACDEACVNEQLDDGNCGGCSVTCAESCIAGECQVTLSSSESATALAVDSASLYWVNSTGSVVKVALSGGSTSTLATGQSDPQAIALDAANLYWTTGDGNLVSMPKAGGTGSTLATGQTGILGLAIGGARAFWAATDGTGYSILTIPVASASAVPTVVSSQVGAAQPYALAVDSNRVYWTTKGGLFAAPLTGGSPDGGSPAESLGNLGGNGVSALAIDGTTAYWGSFASGSGTVQKAPLAGGATTPLATGQFGPNGLASDSKNVYWTTQAGLVMKLPVSGGSPTTIASVSNGGTGIVVDGTTVYWASGDTVQKITPK